MDEPVRFRPTFADASLPVGETISFRSEPEPPSMKAGDSVTLISSEGVTSLEVIAVHEDGAVEIRSKR